MGGTAGGRPVTNSSLPMGARKAEPRPWASCQPLPCSKPRAEKRLLSLSKSALWAIALTDVIPLIIEFDCIVWEWIGSCFALNSTAMGEPCELRDAVV